jgi:hypothetical protein
MRPLSMIKNLFVPARPRPLRILSGPFKGISMNLSLRNQSQVYLGLFERETYPWLKRLSQGIATAVDIGAAHGEYTLYFLKKTQVRRVYAFEPDERMTGLFNANLQLNALADSSRVELSSRFVGSRIDDSYVSLDTLESGIDWPCLIKMDVDGGEEEILSAATTYNLRPGARWLIETHSTALEAACLRILAGHGFRTAVIRKAPWRAVLPELRPSLHNRWLAAWKEDQPVEGCEDAVPTYS